MDHDPFSLDRFIRAQDADGTYDAAVRELTAGRKRSHWMWFVFPQLAGLGSSAMAVGFAISGLPEARAYLAHPVLGARLRQCSNLLLGLPVADPVAVFGGIDAIKLRSSLTLFEAVSAEPVFATVLEKFYGGERDGATRDLLR